MIISKGYASCRLPLDVDSGLLISGLASQLGRSENKGQGFHFSEMGFGTGVGWGWGEDMMGMGGDGVGDGGGDGQWGAGNDICGRD